MVEMQLDHVRGCRTIPELEADLERLGGPATVVCGYVSWWTEGDEAFAPMGAFCTLPPYHFGTPHRIEGSA